MANQATVLDQPHGPLVIKDIPVPQCHPTEVLVKVRAVATNAADWKIYEGHFPQVLPVLLGCDVAGEVAEVGRSVVGLNVGDRVCSRVFQVKCFLTCRQVAGFTQQQLVGMESMMAIGSVASDLRHGGYQKFVPMLPRMIFKIPESVPNEIATTFGCSFFTAAAGVFKSLGFPFSNSGSGVIGAFVVQLLKASHMEVIAVCSAKNFDYIRNLGASHVIDYHGTDVAAQLREQRIRVKKAFDSISSLETCNACLDIVGEGGTVADVQFLEALRRPGIGMEHINVVDILGEAQAPLLSPLVNDWVPNGLVAGILKGVQYQIYSGGLNSIDQAIRDHRDGKIAGKAVITGI
ncbi:quinone reductase [Aspergillus oryzae 3.042]|uniref:Quinone reductase n=1 Tax=Aspergillus oryzae (strain 3.042) TaxID=1160506 RepID=I8THR4_ASPO3|nr:quinone reductase [Aspergillus oryzae 3.042]|eukprot:EIT73585.1 quinone reductase [Aspergillus oryzae 3.042]